ncbi:MAG: hypothetical protein CME61_03440 [Halobacteriovoraceae bacterium]|nr:hypothetical protein [Halobacteriovoraceae bacterium]
MNQTKLLIKISDICPRWVELLGEKSFLDVNFCNRSVLGYYIQLCEHLKISEIVICLPEFSEVFEAHAGQKYPSKVEVNVEISPGHESVEWFVKRNKGFFGDANVVVIDSPLFIYFDLKNQSMVELFNRRLENSSSSISDVKDLLLCNEIASIEDFFETSLDIICNFNENYFFHEARVEDSKVYRGKGIDLTNKESLQGPCLVGSWSQVHSSALVGEGVVLAPFSIVEEGVEIEKSIVYSGVKLLKNSTVRNAVVTRGSVIFPYSEKVNVFFNAEKSEGVTSGERLISGFFIILMFPLFILFKLFESKSVDSKLLWAKDLNGKDTYLLKEKYNSSFIIKYLSLFERFFRCLEGRIFLFGEGDVLKFNADESRPSVFNLSLLIKDPDFKRSQSTLILYYNFKRNALYDIISVIKIYLSNIMQAIR